MAHTQLSDDIQRDVKYVRPVLVLSHSPRYQRHRIHLRTKTFTLNERFVEYHAKKCYTCAKEIERVAKVISSYVLSPQMLFLQRQIKRFVERVRPELTREPRVFLPFIFDA